MAGQSQKTNLLKTKGTKITVLFITVFFYSIPLVYYTKKQIKCKPRQIIE